MASKYRPTAVSKIKKKGNKNLTDNKLAYFKLPYL